MNIIIITTCEGESVLVDTLLARPLMLPPIYCINDKLQSFWAFLKNNLLVRLISRLLFMLNLIFRAAHPLTIDHIMVVHAIPHHVAW